MNRIDEILALMRTAAIAFAEESVMICLRKPINRDFQGQVYRNSKGVLVIDLHPDLESDLEQLFRTFVHEISHLHLHLGHLSFFEKRPLEIEQKHHSEGAFYRLSSEERKNYAEDPLEAEARDFSRAIESIVMEKAKFLNETGIETRLRILSQIKILKSEVEKNEHD